jgi:hypothetical protein
MPAITNTSLVVLLMLQTWYFVSVDIHNCFDSLPQEKLISVRTTRNFNGMVVLYEKLCDHDVTQVIDSLLGDDAYIIRRYATIMRKSNRSCRVRYRSSVSSLSFQSLDLSRR